MAASSASARDDLGAAWRSFERYVAISGSIDQTRQPYVCPSVRRGTETRALHRPLGYARSPVVALSMTSCEVLRACR